MPGLLLVSSVPGSGKTTVAAGLAARLAGMNFAVSLSRRGDDPNATQDRDFFGSMTVAAVGSEPFMLTELPAGDIAEVLAANPGTRALVIATPAVPISEIGALVRSAGPVSGVVLNRVPLRRMEEILRDYANTGLHPVAIIPEDRVLASPTVGQVVAALRGEGDYLQQNAYRTLDMPVIASIAADPGQGYFSRTDAHTVIVRSDKPDLQLAALNAGATFLIVTGGLPVLSYVEERVMEDEIPLLRTTFDTKETVATIETLFGSAAFRGEEKIRRIESLLKDLDVNALLERSAV